jgi:hypothetical protein
MSMGAIRAYGADGDRRFYTGMAVAMFVTVFAGFAPTFYLKSFFPAPPLNPLVFTHGLAFSAWIALFLVQTVLIAGKRPDLHRKLGVVGAGLAAGMVILGVAAATWSTRAGHTPPGIDPRSFLALPFFGITMFASLAALGIVLRRQPQAHKRLMLLATIAMLDAAIARLPGVLALGIPVAYVLQDLFLVACALYDLATRRRVHPVYVWGGLAILVSEPLRLLVSQTPLWLAFGDWLKG